MKRLLLILFVLLLPLQSVWAVAGAFCAHEQDAEAQQHFGHHADQHDHASDPSSDTTPDGSLAESDCGACHFGNCCVVLTSFSVQTTANTAVYVTSRPGSPPAHPNARPERPKWPVSQPALA